MVFLSHDLQVFGPVVEPITINVMDNFISFEWTIKQFFHHQTMFIVQFASRTKTPIPTMDIPRSFWCHGDFEFPRFVFSHIMVHAKLASMLWTRAIQYRAISKFRKHPFALSSMIVFLTESSRYTLPLTKLNRAIHG